MCDTFMYCQRHENDGVPKAEAEFLNFGIFSHFCPFLPIYPILSIKLTVLNLTF